MHVEREQQGVKHQRERQIEYGKVAPGRIPHVPLNTRIVLPGMVRLMTLPHPDNSITIIATAMTRIISLPTLILRGKKYRRKPVFNTA